MPLPSNTAQRWKQPTDAMVRDRMVRSLKYAVDPGARARILEKYARDYSRQHYIIAQLQDDPIMLDAFVSQMLTHPQALLMQVRAPGIEHMDMWRWEPGRATAVDNFLKAQCLPDCDALNETDEERKVFESIDGHLRALNEIEKISALRAMKGEIKVTMCGHGGSETSDGDRWPSQTVGGLDAASLAEISNTWLKHVVAADINRFYTRFDSCRIVLPQERAEDANSLLGQYVKRVHAGSAGIARVEASGSRFLLSNGTTSTQFRRSIHPQKSYAFTADELRAMNWGEKLHVVSDGNSVTESGRNLALTDQEATLISYFQGGYDALFPLLDQLQNMLSRPVTILPADAAAKDPDWLLLHILLQSIGMSGPGTGDFWQRVQHVEVLGGLDGNIRLALGNGNFQYISDQRRNLYLLKEKLLHFDDRDDPGHSPESRAFVQRNSDRANVHESQFLLSAWQVPGREAFSLLQKLAEDTNEHMAFIIPMGDGIGDAMQRPLVSAAAQVLKAASPLSGGATWRSLQVENDHFPHSSLRDVARALPTMTDDELATALSFFVDAYDSSGAVLIDSLKFSFSGALTRQLVEIIDDAIASCPEHEGQSMLSVVRQVNQHRLAGLRHAIANDPRVKQVPAAPGQGAKHPKRARMRSVT